MKGITVRGWSFGVTGGFILSPQVVLTPKLCALSEEQKLQLLWKDYSQPCILPVCPEWIPFRSVISPDSPSGSGGGVGVCSVSSGAVFQSGYSCFLLIHRIKLMP